MDEKSNFITSVDLNEKELKIISRLSGDKNFTTLKGIVENKLLQAEAFNLMIGEETGEDDLKKLYSLQGGYFLWRKIINLIEKSNERFKQISETN